MSSRPECTLEAFIRDAFSYGDEADYQQEVARYEPLRDDIERQMLEFDPETESWRDYRNGMLDNANYFLGSV